MFLIFLNNLKKVKKFVYSEILLIWMLFILMFCFLDGFLMKLNFKNVVKYF